MTDTRQGQNPDLRASVAAMERAAELGRKVAIGTSTGLIVMKGGKLTRIPARAAGGGQERDRRKVMTAQKQQTNPTVKESLTALTVQIAGDRVSL